MIIASLLLGFIKLVLQKFLKEAEVEVVAWQSRDKGACSMLRVAMFVGESKQ